MRLDKNYPGTYVDGIFFTEDIIDEPHQIVGAVRADSVRMNSNQSELRKKLATIVTRKGANAVMSYKYGQKRTLLSIWDDTKWQASGIAIKIE